MADYSINPQFANLTGLQPLQAIDVTRGGALQFQPLQQIQVVSSQPELVAQGIAGAIQGVAQGALKGITAKWEKEEELAKEQRKYAFELEKEKEKQKTENLSFINQERVKLAAQHGLEGDYAEQDAALVEAGRRVMGVMPSGYTPKERPSTKKVTSEQPAPVEVPLPDIDPTQQDIPVVNKPVPVVVKAPVDTTEVVTTQPVETASTTQDTNILAPLEQPQQPPQPQPSLTGLEPVVTTSPIPSEMVKIPAQPTDPKAPRNLGKNVEFQPSDASVAVDVAGKLSTPYWEVTAVENPRTKKWYLQAKDNSKAVADMQTQAANLNISVERLALDKQKEAREAQKAEIERIKEERARLKEDKAYQKKLKKDIDDRSKDIALIDTAINKIQDNPELVGRISEYYGDEKKIPLTPLTYQEAAFIAKSFFGVDKYMDKVQTVQNIAASLNSVASNIGWNKFSEMKELSSTGSAGVGGFSNEERQSLQQTQGALDLKVSPELNLDTLYRLKNGAVKILLNAYGELKPLDKSVKNPISTDIYNSYVEKINEINSALAKATPEQKESRNYKDALKRLESLQRTIDFIDQFSKPLN